MVPPHTDAKWVRPRPAPLYHKVHLGACTATASWSSDMLRAHDGHGPVQCQAYPAPRISLPLSLPRALCLTGWTVPPRIHCATIIPSPLTLALCFLGITTYVDVEISECEDSILFGSKISIHLTVLFSRNNLSRSLDQVTDRCLSPRTRQIL